MSSYNDMNHDDEPFDPDFDPFPIRDQHEFQVDDNGPSSEFSDPSYFPNTSATIKHANHDDITSCDEMDAKSGEVTGHETNRKRWIGCIGVVLGLVVIVGVLIAVTDVVVTNKERKKNENGDGTSTPQSEKEIIQQSLLCRDGDPKIVQPRDLNENTLSFWIVGVNQTFNAKEKTVMQEAIMQAYNNVSNWGCDDKFNRFMFDAKVVHQEVLNDLESGTATFTTTVDTVVSCDSCLPEESFATIYPDENNTSGDILERRNLIYKRIDNAYGNKNQLSEPEEPSSSQKIGKSRSGEIDAAEVVTVMEGILLESADQGNFPTGFAGVAEVTVESQDSSHYVSGKCGKKGSACQTSAASNSPNTIAPTSKSSKKGSKKGSGKGKGKGKGKGYSPSPSPAPASTQAPPTSTTAAPSVQPAGFQGANPTPIRFPSYYPTPDPAGGPSLRPAGLEGLPTSQGGQPSTQGIPTYYPSYLYTPDPAAKPSSRPVGLEGGDPTPFAVPPSAPNTPPFSGPHSGPHSAPFFNPFIGGPNPDPIPTVSLEPSIVPSDEPSFLPSAEPSSSGPTPVAPPSLERTTDTSLGFPDLCPVYDYSSQICPGGVFSFPKVEGDFERDVINHLSDVCRANTCAVGEQEGLENCQYASDLSTCACVSGFVVRDTSESEDKSCFASYNCNCVSGTIEHDACEDNFACNYNFNTISGGCTGLSACNCNRGVIENSPSCIGTGDACKPLCSGQSSCNFNEGTIKNPSASIDTCNDESSCNFNKGVIIDSCSSPQSCNGNTLTIALGCKGGSNNCNCNQGTITGASDDKLACSGGVSMNCNNNLGTIDGFACNGDGSCNNNQGTILSGSCNGADSCNNVPSCVTIQRDTCNGSNDCNYEDGDSCCNDGGAACSPIDQGAQIPP